MKRIIAILCVIMTFALCPAFAEDSSYICVQKQDFIEIEPDMAEMQITVETSDNDINNATTKNKEKAQEIYKALAGVLQSGDYLKTSTYSITPKYTQVEGKRTFDTYVITNTITLKTCDLSLVPKIIDTAIEKGANKINNLNLTVANFDEEGTKLLSDLTKKAKIQANAIANSVNAKVVGVKKIEANYSNGNSPRYYSMALNKSSNSANIAATPFEKGKVKIYGNVNAEFFVK